MKIYLTRHGHVDYSGADHGKGDIPLSGLGHIQAGLLGEAMKELGFGGPVFASPYRRTMMTAQYAAEACKADIYPDGALREFFFSTQAALRFQGMTLRELQKSCKSLAKDASLPYPWWEPQKDDYAGIVNRSREFWERILEQGHEEILAVCHDASVLGAVNFFNHRYQMGFPGDFQGLVDYMMDKDLNCGLSCLEIDERGALASARFFMTQHLPEGHLTANGSRMRRPDVVRIDSIPLPL